MFVSVTGSGCRQRRGPTPEHRLLPDWLRDRSRQPLKQQVHHRQALWRNICSEGKGIRVSSRLS